MVTFNEVLLWIWNCLFFVPKPNLIFISLKAVTLIPWTEKAQTTLSSVLKSATLCSTGQRGTSLVVCHLNK